MLELLAEPENYVADFNRIEKDLSGQGSPAIHRLRKAAIASFADLGFPKTHDEDWRFTNIAPLVQTPFELGSAADGLPKPSSSQGGVIVTSLAEALKKHPHLVEPHLGRYADYKSHAFTALNTAFLQDGVFIYVPKGKVVEEPIHLEFLAAASVNPVVWHRRVLVVLEANSQVRLVEHYSGPRGKTYFTNAITEIAVGANARMDHYKVQEEGDRAFHVATLQIHMDRASNFSSHNVIMGGALVRNNINAVLDAEGCECTLNGLYLGTGQQLLDNHTMIDHAKPRCASHELYKGILGGRAKGVFNGKIFVRQDAQKTDAKQTNKTLLLSDDATINTKPELEIYADDVKCTHGATVGQLDDESIFYLRTRGIGLEQARNLLTFAFANDIINRIQIEPLRDKLEHALLTARRLPYEGKEAKP